MIKKGVEQGLLVGVNPGKFEEGLKNHLLISLTEKRTKEEMEALIDILSQ